MVRDVTGQKKIDSQTVKDAISVLKESGREINPYTVADEAKVPRSAIFRSAELMNLIGRAALGEAGEPPAGEGRWQIMEERLAELESWNRELEARVQQLESDLDVLASAKHDVWLSGYRAAQRDMAAGEDEGAGEELAAGQQAGPDTAYDAAPETAPAAAEEYEAEPAMPSGYTDAYTYEPGAETYGGMQEEGAEEFAAREEEHAGAEADALADRWESGMPLIDPLGPEAGALDERYKHQDEDYGGAQPEEGDAWRAGGQGYGSPADDSYESEPEGGQAESGQEAGETIDEDQLRDLLKMRFSKQAEESKESEGQKNFSGTRFVGGNKPTTEAPKRDFVFRTVPPEIRKACLVLGIRPEELSHEVVHKAWKREMANPGGHPDLGGDTEIAIYLNTAKDNLFRFLDQHAPKLGKKFGGPQEGKPGEKAGQESEDD